jgi:hypothetical protein
MTPRRWSAMLIQVVDVPLHCANERDIVPSIVWNGTLIEQLELVAAIERNCECKFDGMGVRLDACHSHTMLVRDQRALNGLLWARRLAKHRLAEEGISAP